ncbi:TPA: hypothetical protein I6193_003629 [Vibrio cholerae]|nr:hypothetical protein [Vibrio cholerae]
MSTLFIIGNGFDIWNGLPTSYRNFNEKYKEHLEKHIHYFDDLCGIDSDWANFEESLGSFNQDSFHDNAAMQPSLEELGDEPKRLYGYEDEIAIKKEELVRDITSAFNGWIRSVNVYAAKKLMHFYFPAYFINFNYTTTLQDVYKVNDSDVLHIHGKIGKELIFGHGRETDLSESEDENNEPWFHETKREVSQVLSVFHKPVNDILARNRTILEGYDNVENIVVIGHSINNIDIPYFQCILNAYPDANWQNYNYENIEEEIDEVSVTHRKLLALGVPEQRLKSFSSEKLKELYPLP